MAITECGTSGGTKAFLTLGFEIWERVDAGASSWWKRFGVMPISHIGDSSQSGMRGLSCVPYNGSHALLAVTEGTGDVWRIDPNTGQFTEEANTLSLQETAWSVAAVKYGVSAYNNMIFINNSVVFGEGNGYVPTVPTSHTYEALVSGAKGDAGSGLWIRSGSGTSYTYTLTNANLTPYLAALGQIAANTPQPPAGPCSPGPNCPLMISTRAALLSPFPSDAGQYIYFGGFDANATAVHNTAWIERVPLSTLGGIP
jgi:hypothetical protein